MKYYYVQVPRLNRNTLIANADWIHSCKFGLVEYNEGGWSDHEERNVAPHFRFESREDALAYILAKGGEFSEEVPLTPPNDALKDWLT